MKRTSGISLMLLIFLSLCLIVFSLLSLSGATADETLSKKAADRTIEYYRSSSSANALLADIDNQLALYLKKAEASQDPEAVYLSQCEAISQDIPEAIWKENTICFSVPITEDQHLQAELSITYPEQDDDTLYNIISWKTVNTKEWKADRSQNLYRKTAYLNKKIKEKNDE